MDGGARTISRVGRRSSPRPVPRSPHIPAGRAPRSSTRAARREHRTQERKRAASRPAARIFVHDKARTRIGHDKRDTSGIASPRSMSRVPAPPSGRTTFFQRPNQIGGTESAHPEQENKQPPWPKHKFQK